MNMMHCEPGKAGLWEAGGRPAPLPNTFSCDFDQEDLVICPEGSPGFLRFSRPLWEGGALGRLTGDGKGHFHLHKPSPKFTPVLANLVSEWTGAYLQRQSTLSTYLCKLWADRHFAATVQTIKLW